MNGRLFPTILLFGLAYPSSAYPSPGYPSAAYGEGLGDYLSGYGDTDEQYGISEYDGTRYGPRYTYGNVQRPRLNKEAMAALLSAAIDDYIQYDSYNDQDGTWYDEGAEFAQPPQIERQDPSLMQLFFNPRPARYSLEDLENMERTAAREDNTENQLHQLTKNKQQMTKKSVMPVLGRGPAVTPLLKKGQKEVMFEVPATSVRRPVFARTISTYPEETKPENQKFSTMAQPQNENLALQNQNPPKNTQVQPKEVKIQQQQTTAAPETSSSSSRSKIDEPVPRASETPYLKDSYETLRNFLDRERKLRQDRDEKQEERRPHKRFITEQEALTQQLSNLKKSVA